MIKALIIDDEPKCTSLVKTILEKKCANIKVTGTAQSLDEAYKLITDDAPDLLFLDVEMPYGSGFELLEKFPVHEFEVIFITAYDKFALPAIKADAIDFLLKPFTEKDLIASVKKAEQRITDKRAVKNRTMITEWNTSGKRIALPTADGMVFLNLDEIIRCEASGSYTEFYLTGGRKELVSKNLSQYEDVLEPFNFYRIHSSHMINIRYVKKYVKGRGGYVIMEDGATIDVSVRKKTEFIENLLR
ncbi:MAG: response regulator transcription factor [Bacteroidetes bacterium]|nr:response regulator transcription factor [Bacteroidota bacterium]